MKRTLFLACMLSFAMIGSAQTGVADGSLSYGKDGVNPPSVNNPADATSLIVNNDFNQGNMDGWTTTFVRGESATNVGYQYSSYTNGEVQIYRFIEAWISSWDATALGDGEFSQTIANLPAGIYMLTADCIACNQNNSANSVKGAQLFAVWGDLDSYTEIATGNSLPEHFELIFISAGGDLTLGVRTHNTTANWLAADNFTLTYYGGSSNEEMSGMRDAMVEELTTLSKKPQNKEVANQTLALIDKAKAATGYEEMANVCTEIQQLLPIIHKSIEAYERLAESYGLLEDELGKTSPFTSPATVSDATSLKKEVLNAYENGTYDEENIDDAISRMSQMITRFSYLYLDIAVTVPGSMGDSILNKVENFTDVQSIKISGTLNDADISTIQTRLSQLKEIDMIDVNMTSLPNRFFYQRSLLEIVKLPTKLTTIGEYAFYQCRGLQHIDFPSTLITINRYAFQDCDNLQEVILPERLATLGDGAFYSCDNNKYVKIPSTLNTIDSYTFYYNINLKTVDFAEGLTHIDNYAFYDCYALNNLKFPSSLYYIGSNTFAYNRSLSSVEFNEGLFQIADNAFYDCDALEEITLPSSLALAYASPFDYCDNLKKVTCLSIEPPYMTDQIPQGLSMEGRELYVPALSINVYKQTAGWDKFQTIKPIDYLPENFTVLSDLRLTLPEAIPADYKPNVSVIHDQKGTWYYQYGSLTVNGEGTLSMSNFSMVWDPSYQYGYSNRNQNYCTLINNSHLRSDNVSIDLYTSNDRWSFVTFPFDVKVSDIETISDGTTNWVIRKYDGQQRAAGETSETWVKMNNDDVLNAGEGYIIQSSRYINTSWQDYSGFRMNAVNNSKKNNIFTTDDVTVTLSDYPSEFAHNRSWNLIGNPYPSYYDTRFMEFDAPITVWNMNNNTYTAYSPDDDSYILCPGEAFFVQRPIDNGTIVFNKDGRQTNRDARVIEASAKAKVFGTKATENRSIVNICISDGNNTDRTRVVLNDNASVQYEMDKDASKFMSTDATVPQIYTLDNGVKYAINERPVADGTVNLCAYIGTDGLYSIGLGNIVDGYKVVLEDKAANKSVVLNGEAEYVFSAKAGLYDARFVLHFTNEATQIDDIDAASKTDDTIYSIDGIKVTKPIQKGIYIQNGKKIMLNK